MKSGKAAWGFWQPCPEQRQHLQHLADRAGQVELKLLVPGRTRRHLGLTQRDGQARRVYFLDTPGLELYRQGLIVRLRSRGGRRRDDAVVKMRSVQPGAVPERLRRAGRFTAEVDALPGHYVFSGALKVQLGRGEVKRRAAAGRPLTKLLSTRQRRVVEDHLPAGVCLDDLRTYGPIEVRRHELTLDDLDRPLTVEQWTYPDGAALLEVSTRSSAGRAPAVAARVTDVLSARGVVPAGTQFTKTERALRAGHRPAC